MTIERGASWARQRVLLSTVVLATLLLALGAPGPARADLITPTLTTAASSTVPVGGSINDTAVLITPSMPVPTGTITFALYDVTDTKCAGTPVFKQAVPFALPVMSPAYTPTKAGVFNWIVSYGGDTNYAAVSGKCGDPGESVTVTALTPSIVATASAGTPLGGTITDSAVLSGGYKPSGTITFKLFGPTDPTCSAAPVFTQSVPVATPTVTSPIKPTVAGTYRFVATYNGDAANNVATTACADPTAAVTVSPPTTTPPPTTPPPVCAPGAMASQLLTSLINVLTGGPNTAFKATCSAGVRIVLRAREIRPGNRGFPHKDGYTTVANVLTHSTPNGGGIAFSFNAQGVALRNYAGSKGLSLTVFAIVHVRPDRTLSSSESVGPFTLH